MPQIIRNDKIYFLKLTLLFLLWRFSLFVIAAISPIIIKNFSPTFPYWQERLVSTGLPHFLWSFANFDGVHYLGIAKDAYAYQYTQAFFPFYPMLVNLASPLFGGNLLLSGLFISNFAFFLSVIVFFKLVSKLHGDKKAYWSCIFLLTFPTSFYFGSLYTEGLFFLFITTFFYLIEKKRFILAAPLALFASATRLIGIFLSIFYLKKDLRFLFLFFVSILGFVIYVAYLELKFNNPFYFLSSQEIFGQERSLVPVFPLQVVYRYLKILLTTSDLILVRSIIELFSAVGGFLILLFSIKKIKTEWLIFSFFSIITPVLTGTFTSMPRYILVAFPIYIFFSLIKNTLLKVFLASIFLVGQFILTVLFTQGYWVA